MANAMSMTTNTDKVHFNNSQPCDVIGGRAVCIRKKQSTQYTATTTDSNGRDTYGVIYFNVEA